MMRQNGIAFLRDHSFPAAAKKAESVEERLITFCQIGPFCDLCSENMTEIEGMCSEVAITSRNFEAYYPNMGRQPILRLEVRTFPDKKSRRQFLEQYEQIQKQDPVRLSEELHLLHLEDAGTFWMPCGLEVAGRIKNAVEREYRAHGAGQVESPLFSQGPGEREILFEEKHYILTVPTHRAFSNERAVWEWVHSHHFLPTKDLEGLFCSRGTRGDVFHIFCSEAEAPGELFWALQSISRVATLLGLKVQAELVETGDTKKNKLLDAACRELGLEYRIRNEKVRGTALELLSPDLLGRLWPVSRVGFSEGRGFHIEGSFIFSLERVMALLVEKHNGLLPFWLAPCQVKILPVVDEARRMAEEIFDVLTREQVRVKIDASGPLGERIYRAGIERIPCAIILGFREVREQKMCVRYFGPEPKQNEQTLLEFMQEIHTLNEER
jgi:threonyl-tRNA synthetase